MSEKNGQETERKRIEAMRAVLMDGQCWTAGTILGLVLLVCLTIVVGIWVKTP